MLLAQNISYTLKSGKALLKGVSLAVQAGKLLAVVGANGAGKSTLLKTLSGQLKPTSGKVSLGAKNLLDISSKGLARRRAVLAQSVSVGLPYTVEEVVMMGRLPHDTDRLENEKIVEAAMQAAQVYSLRERNCLTLSGGEQQRVHLAKALAQIWSDDPSEPRYLLLDEPTSNLDIAQQQHTLTAVREALDRNVGALAIVHDLNLAIQYADDLLLLKQGRTVASGPLRQTLTPALLEETFGHRVRIWQPDDGPHPVAVPVSPFYETTMNHFQNGHAADEAAKSVSTLQTP